MMKQTVNTPYITVRPYRPNLVDNNIERVRIVDYKTGGDNTGCQGFVNLFEKNRQQQTRKSCVCSYSYTCNDLRRDKNNYHGPLQTHVYLAAAIIQHQRHSTGKDSERAVDRLPDLQRRVQKRLAASWKESDLFNPEIPFSPIRIMTPANFIASSEELIYGQQKTDGRTIHYSLPPPKRSYTLFDTQYRNVEKLCHSPHRRIPICQQG